MGRVMRQSSAWQRLASAVNSLGRCPWCMRRSFVTAAWTWLAVTVFDHLTHAIFAILPVEILATAFTILWIAHSATFAFRQSATSASLVAPVEGEIVNRGRRAVFPLFAKTLMASAVIMALPVIGRARDKCYDTCRDAREQCISACGPEPDEPQTPEEARQWGQWHRCYNGCHRQFSACIETCPS